MSATLGQLIDSSARRDAIHVAIAPVVAHERLAPGVHVGFVADSKSGAVGTDADAIGIVDPFLLKPVDKGDRFYLFLYPNTVTSLRHEWTHPAFVSPEAASESKQWLAAFAGLVEMSYDELLDAAKRYQECGDYVVQHGRDSWRDAFYGVADQFWQHYSAATGQAARDDGSFFSCSC